MGEINIWKCQACGHPTTTIPFCVTCSATMKEAVMDTVSTRDVQGNKEQKIGREAFAAELLGHLDRITSTTAAYHFVRNMCKIELGQEPDSLGAEIDH